MTTPLAAKLRARIAASGPLPVDEFMAACLTDPEHGYYRGADRLGRAGDFTTAPEISQVFGELIGLWAAEVWRLLGAPHQVKLVELGPGRGTLMADALRAIAKAAPEFRAALQVHLVEISPGFRALQRAALGDSPAWHDRLADVPDGPAIVVANEYFDALPVKQYVRSDHSWRERGVGHDGTRFVFELASRIADPPLEHAHRAASAGDVVEISPSGRAAAAALAARVVQHGGAALIIDYGPPASGIGATLQALSRHKMVDPLEAPGAADLTAHVDFAALARIARETGARAFGPVPQGAFLQRLGLSARMAILIRHAGARQVRDLVRGVERLIDPAQMGGLFKALAVVGPGDIIPPGFEAQ